MLFKVLAVTEKVTNSPEKPEFHGKVYFEIDAEPTDIYSSDKVKEFIFPTTEAAIAAWRERAKNPTACPPIDYRYVMVEVAPFRTKNRAGVLSTTIHHEMRVGVRYDSDGNPTEKAIDKANRIITANHQFVAKGGVVNESGTPAAAAEQVPPVAPPVTTTVQ